MVFGKQKRLAYALLSFIIIISSISCMVLPASASIKPNYSAYDYGEYYKTSKYYTQLLDAKSKLTGDHRYDVVAIALSQLGYHEGDRDADMDGWNLSGTNNYVEYNRLFCKLEGIWGYAWCAAFVSWCQYQAGIPAAIDCSEVSCPRMINEILKPQGLYVTRDSGYVPLTGDLIYFKSSTSNAISTHVGLVVGVKDGYVYTVEGNASECVSRHKYAIDDTYIVGYGVLKYETVPGTDYSSFSLEDDSLKPGDYFVTADSLNVRSGAGTSHSILGTLSRNDPVKVTEFSGNWGKIDFGGKAGWISASYIRSASNNVYTVEYNVGEGRFALVLQRKYPGTDLTLTSETPTLTGHSFIGWATERGGEVKYAAGSTYSSDADLTLYAVYKPDICKVNFLDYDGRILATAEFDYGTKVTAPESIVPTRESDGEFAYEFAGWEPKLSLYIKQDTDYKATYTSRELTAEEKEEYLAAQATEELTDEPERSGGCSSILPAYVLLPIISIAITPVIKRKRD